jgi:hypothetical protein
MTTHYQKLETPASIQFRAEKRLYTEGNSDMANRVIISFKCTQCKKEFDCDVGTVSIDIKTCRPKFTNKVICPRCGERTIDGVLLTELGQSQLTEATF